MPRDFSVVAIVAAYNEADIIEHVIRALADQGVQVYFLDDGSTDRTVEIVERHVGRGVLAIERLAEPIDGGARPFTWTQILRKKTEVATEVDADWFIHHDADEFRESPWRDLSLKDAIQHVDSLGFNAIDFLGFDFWPTDDRFREGEDVREALTFCSEPASYDRVQVRAWKKTALVDLVSSGGHEAQFAGRRVFPLRFILRHYPIRGQAHGERKVFRERCGRFVEAERARGWHRQYDDRREGDTFLRHPSTLTPYDPEAARAQVIMSPRYPDELQQALCAAQSEIAKLGHELDARERQIARLRDVVAQDAGEIESHKTELKSRRQDIAALEEGLEQRTAEIERWRTAVEGLTQQIQAFERSLSWRWTAPARAAARLLRER